ncbi:P-loop containing nucleoside triphosphate hydrolase protein [Neolentinus lepideus HHB14362 ss-1]|uniref:p-loop containing nucleoside triphosphate hydrolase protein n=1 Tax=Neolentinus lepideus HHB14362 ss-1 TaxID=1314782 RepID=A0A165SKR8_9AGAM|nr:P-loop containing nucleoside triphosphate hydrolase protein [Neolentinus lepideus HHB14362 ss-1]
MAVDRRLLRAILFFRLSTTMDATNRSAKLWKTLNNLIEGKVPVTRQNYLLFLEAIYTATDVVSCIDRVLQGPKGATCLQESMRIDLTATFLNGAATKFLQSVSKPELEAIGGGAYLERVVMSITEPPIFWRSFQDAFSIGQLQDDAQVCFSWLLLQLVLLPPPASTTHRALAQDSAIINALSSSSLRDVRANAEAIKNVVATSTIGDVNRSLNDGPGGRHDNDFHDFHEIAILPTADELTSKKGAFLRPSSALDDPSTADKRVAIHLDNQFRLLREDMLYEMREEIEIAVGIKKGKHRGMVFDGLTLTGLYDAPQDSRRSCKWGLTFELHSDLPQFKGVDTERRKSVLQKDRRIMKDQSLTCLIADEVIVAFPSVYRDEDLLAKKPPVIVLQFEGKRSTSKALLAIRTAKSMKLLQIDTAVFAYEPILQALQETTTMPLSRELLLFNDSDHVIEAAGQPFRIVNAIKANPLMDLQALLGTKTAIKLDEAQSRSLLSGLTQSVSLIQGPPGTGKSFIGALLAKILYDFTDKKILVVCFTNHALDQFLEDLLNIGIPSDSMVRLGSKSTSLTEHLMLKKQARIAGTRSKTDWKLIDALKSRAAMLSQSLESAFHTYERFGSDYTSLLEHLEFEHPDFFDAFRVPEVADGTKRVGKKGKVVGANYLIEQWIHGKDAGIFKSSSNVVQAADVWTMSPDARRSKQARWVQEMLADIVEAVANAGQEYNECQSSIDRRFSDGNTAIIASKRIISCTTTGAAIYRQAIRAADVDIVLVEEAGEILESHILTALSPKTEQLILIGDHKQLRPKVNNYTLTVEKGEGFDLNRSLFERLVLKGYPHETLKAQHRMRPEISRFVRELTYPDLIDAPKTQGRSDLRGVENNVVFIDHNKPEGDVSEIGEPKDVTTKASKQNTFEVRMVLKIVRYLAQQGYGTDKMVVLTPYLGQLRALQLALKQEVDPILNDLDTYDLVRAGLLTPAASKAVKKPLRIATIDNYQGEESEVVIASLTRSNAQNDIGFMFSPERLTVLLSRARDAFIMIGNASTFMKSRKGGQLWSRLFAMLQYGGHMYSGLPVKCERHPDRQALLQCPEDFDNECPDGGCLQLCGAVLSCGVHTCPMKCHQISDHSKMPCEHLSRKNCPNGHLQSWKCHQGEPISCKKCDQEAKLAEKKQREEFALQEKRDEEQRAHAQRMAELDQKIAQQRAAIRDAQLAAERAMAKQQKEKELQEATALSNQAASSVLQSAKTSLSSFVQSFMPSASNPSPPNNTTQPPPLEKTSKPKSSDPTPEDNWNRQKNLFGATSSAIDAIMELSGLEEVKAGILRIKDKVDTAARQNSSLADERFNACMLGNPGTGKTTVARLYGKFLASSGIIPGNMFVETTGSRLGNDGVSGMKKQLDDVINAGGGTIFVDEAYQLTDEHNHEGKKVLDFLLAEMENQVGKVVFVFAGYTKEMESFFEHNPGLRSRVPITFQFKDYEDAQLLDMLEKSIYKKWQGRMKVNDPAGIRGLAGRIAIRRLGRGRGTKGFGNARALANMFSKITERQSSRLSKALREGQSADDFLLVQEDIIGPEPSKVMQESKAWKKLQGMIGLGAVKKTVEYLSLTVQTNYQRELLEKEPHQVPLNRVFLGSPGTGKTTVAKLYGRILAELGLLSNGEVVVKNPADFVGAYIGHSEKQTKNILAATVGKVLVIDEAYMLYGGSGAKSGTDQFKTAVIDTIVAEVQSVPGDDRCVLLLGYKEQMEEMFQNVNPGLSRRFAIEDAFHFADYTDEELLKALELKLKDQDLTATDRAKRVAIESLSRLRNRPNFGNIGEVENLLGRAKVRYQARQATLPPEQRSPDGSFEPEDFDPEFARGEQASTNLAKLFADVIGCEGIVQKLATWQTMAKNMKSIGKDPRDQVPTNFIFKGPPGTGKTTTARKMGQVYYDMGFLSSAEVVECSVSDLVGQYVGQTGPKTRKAFEKALGRVLFVDEAYRLAEGRFAKEAIDEVVDILTQEKFRGKLIVILAGYDQDMNQLLAVNSGLASRFPEEICFTNMSPDHCLQVLKAKLAKQNVLVDALEDKQSANYQKMVDILNQLCSLPSWGNARDMETLAKLMTTVVFSSSPLPTSDAGTAKSFILSDQDAIKCIDAMLSARRERLTNVPRSRGNRLSDAPVMTADRTATPPPPASVSVSTQKAAPPPKPATPPAAKPARQPPQNVKNPANSPSNRPWSRNTADVPSNRPWRQNVTPPPQAQVQNARAELTNTTPQAVTRDPGVSDAVWQQLQRDKQSAERERQRRERAIRDAENQRRAAERKEREAREAAARLEAQLRAAKEAKEREELMRQREAERLRELKMREERARWEAKRKEEERKRQEEARVQAKLRNMGVCVAGFQWIKQGGGYRCAGGAHFISDAQLGI